MKYLKELKLPTTETPYGWETEDLNKETILNQIEEYGFDQRETYNMELTFYHWLYSRLKMFTELTNVNLRYHEFIYKGKQLTQEDCIEKMLEGCKIAITLDECDLTVEQKEKVEDVINIWKMTMRYMWW